MVARELIENYKMNQGDVAKLLGISQPAISQYLRNLRGNRQSIFGNADVIENVKVLCQKIYSQRSNNSEFTAEIFGLCRIISEKLTGGCQSCPSVGNDTVSSS